MFLCSIQINLQFPLNQKYNGFGLRKEMSVCWGSTWRALSLEVTPSLGKIFWVWSWNNAEYKEYYFFPQNEEKKWPKTDFPATLTSQPTMASPSKTPTPGHQVSLMGHCFHGSSGVKQTRTLREQNQEGPRDHSLTFLLLPQPPPSSTTSRERESLSI